MTSKGILDGQTALVTGASRGIGKAIAMALGEIGAEVVINYSNSEQKAEEVVAAIRTMNSKAYSLQANISEEDSVNQLIDNVLQKSGQIDILVNNAGITKDGLLMRMKKDQWQEVINLNLTGAFLCTRAVSKSMIKRKKGRIINISSVVGLMGNGGQANYAAAKAGLIGLTKSTAKEFASRGITVNSVAPGFISTDMSVRKDGVHEGDTEWFKDVYLKYEKLPMKRYGQTDDISGAVYFFCSEDSKYITGQTLLVDGGVSSTF